MLATKHAERHHAEGFTIVELLIATILCAIVTSVFITALVAMTRSVTIQKTQLELSESNQIALNTIERDVRLALAYETTPAYSTFVDSYGPTNTNEGWSGTWSYKGTDSDHRVLILRENATTTNPFAASRNPVYVQGFLANLYGEQNTNFNCTLYNAATAPTGALTYNPTLPYYLIYFVRDGNLYRRVLTDTTTPVCSNTPQYQKQSCPEADTSQPASCKANDELIAENVASFTVTYYSQGSSSTPTFTDINAYAQSDSDIFEEVSNITATLKLQKSAGGSVRSTTLSVTVSKV